MHTEQQEQPPVAEKPSNDKFTRFVHWSNWTSADPADILHVRSVEECEAECLKDTACVSATYANGICGLFHGRHPGMTAIGSTTSFRSDTEKVCYGPYRPDDKGSEDTGMPSTCHATEEAAVNDVLRKNRVMSIFKGQFFSPRVNAWD